MGRKRKNEIQATIKGKLKIDDIVSKAKLLYLMRNFRDSVEFSHNLMRKGLDENRIVKIVISRVLNNSHYAYSALQRAKLYREQPYLKLTKPQLYSVGKSNEKGNRNVRFVSTDKVLIKIPHANGKHEFVEFKVKFGKNYLPIVEELINPNFAFSTGVKVDEDKFYIYVNVPIELYKKHLPVATNTRNNGKYLASFDLNPDRICMTIVDRKGLLIDVRNEYFPEVINYSKEKAQDVRRKALKKLVEYALNHNVGVLVAEKLEKPKTKSKNKTTNRKISKFALREYLNHLKILAERANVKLHLVDPSHTSTIGKMLAKSFGLDVHSCSAYALALKYINSH